MILNTRAELRLCRRFSKFIPPWLGTTKVTKQCKAVWPIFRVLESPEYPTWTWKENLTQIRISDHSGCSIKRKPSLRSRQKEKITRELTGVQCVKWTESFRTSILNLQVHLHVTHRHLSYVCEKRFQYQHHFN